MTTVQTIPAELAPDFEILGEARNVIRAFVVDRGKSFLVSHSDRTRYIIVCRDTFCKFGIRPSVLRGPKIRVTRCTAHTCSPITSWTAMTRGLVF